MTQRIGQIQARNITPGRKAHWAGNPEAHALTFAAGKRVQYAQHDTPLKVFIPAAVETLHRAWRSLP